MVGRGASYYKSLGYSADYMSEFEVSVEDLSKESHAKILVQCDFCNNEVIKEYRTLIRERENYPLDCCKRCKGEKTKITNMKKYGVENVMQVKEHRDTLKKVIFEKYGVENISSLPENKEKVKITNLKKYGFENYTQTEEYKRKTKETSLKKYGVEHYTQTEEYRQKRISTCIKKYGVESPTKNPKIVEKIRKTCIKRYGVDNYFKSDIFKNNLKIFNLDKYGVEYFAQTDDFKTKARATWDSKTEEEVFNIKQRANNTMSLNGNCKTSSQQIYVYELLKDDFDVVLNHPEGNFNLDIMLTHNDIKIDIEYDGWYWHKDRGRQDFIRDCINKRKGYKVLRIKSKEKLPDKSELLSCIYELINTDVCFKELKMSDWRERGE